MGRLSSNPIAALIIAAKRRGQQGEVVGAVELAPGVIAQNDDMLRKDFINGLTHGELGKAGSWPGIKAAGANAIRMAVAEGMNHPSAEVKRLTSKFQDLAQAQVSMLDELQRFGLGGRGEEKDREYLAGMRSLKELIDTYLADFDKAKKTWDAEQAAAQAEADRRIKEAQASAQADTDYQRELEQQRRDLEKQRQAWELQKQQMQQDWEIQKQQMEQQAEMQRQAASLAASLPQPDYSQWFGPDPFADAGYYGGDYNPGGVVLDAWGDPDPLYAAGGYNWGDWQVSGEEAPKALPMLRPEQQAEALVSLAGTDPRADFIITGIQRIADDDDFAAEICDDPDACEKLQENAELLCNLMEEELGDHVSGIVHQMNGGVGEDPTKAFAPFANALVPMLPDIIISAMALIKAAQKGDEGAKQLGAQIRAGAAQGDADSAANLEALTIANALVESQERAPRRTAAFMHESPPQKKSLADTYRAGIA